MKSAGKTILIILVLSIACSTMIYAQRGTRGMKTDSTSGDRPGRMMHMRQMPMPSDSLRSEMRNRMGHMRMNDRMWYGPMYRGYYGFGTRPGGAWGPGFRSRHDFGPGSFYHDRDRWQTPGRILANIPNLTDKQKKDIASLRDQHLTEMKKFRDETETNMNNMKDSFRNKVRDILTDEQKKYLEENVSPDHSDVN
jgi:Na+-transporting NADH:ubiquinone oxidoreductase subunit NqrC